jgi:hypothetical protein
MSVNHTLAPTVAIRAARGSDGEALEQLARLDSQRPLTGDVLVAEQDGRLVAALAGDRVVADPFRPTEDIVALLQFRAGGKRRDRRHGARVRIPRLRPA